MDSKITLQEIQNKNNFVFKKIFEDHYPELVLYANKYLYDMSSSEDVVQEIFIFLWEKPTNIDIKTSLKAYLFSMVRNRCLNILKSIKITYSLKIIEKETSFHTNYFMEDFQEDEIQVVHQQVINKIETLPFKMQEIVRLRFIENYPYNEIAEKLNISTNTVKTQLKRAKLKLGQLNYPLWLILLTRL